VHPSSPTPSLIPGPVRDLASHRPRPSSRVRFRPASGIDIDVTSAAGSSKGEGDDAKTKVRDAGKCAKVLAEILGTEKTFRAGLVVLEDVSRPVDLADQARYSDCLSLRKLKGERYRL
jgi:hypothetical protein